MAERKVVACFMIIIALFIAFFLLTGCKKNYEILENTTQNLSGNQSEKLYPTIIGFDVKYCEGLGYAYEYRKDENGKYTGYCRLTRDIECLSDDFAGALCHREFSLCEIKGYTLKIMVGKKDNVTVSYPICIFPDKNYCKEVDFFNRRCYIKW